MTDGVHKLGEVLRTAREAKGVDLVRVERDTKIRERYLSALERGEYRELPGAVYTKGFLRNYGAYLGLDPEYLIDLYRLEASAAAGERPRPPSPPRPLAGRRSRAFVVTPGAVVAAILTLLVGGFVAYLGFEFVNFARTPELRITDPPGNVNAHPSTTITVRGITEPNARVAVRDLPENPTVTADAEGRFEITVDLLPGSNVMTLQATDPETGRESEPETRTIIVASDVASPSPSAPAFALTEPAADVTVSGRLAMAGTAAPNATVTATATLERAGTPSFTVTDAAGQPVALQPAAPRPPEPAEWTADASGAFEGELGLAPGVWRVRVAVGGAADPIERRITVAPGDGLRGILRVADGDSYLEADEDGEAVAGVSGTIAEAGERVDLRAERDLRIRVGNAGAVRLTVNGIALGAMGADGAVVEWRITRTER